MEDNFFEDVIASSFQETQKQFSEVFRVKRTNFGPEVSVLMPIKIGDASFDQDSLKVNDLKINNISLIDLQGKTLIGKIHSFDNVFHIESFEPPKEMF